MVKRVYKAVFSPLLLLLLAGSGHAQSPPLPASSLSAPPPIVGFVSSYEIRRTLRAAGFEPLAPPLREGTDYVVRATDFRGILMHVVVDARTAAIRDVTRIVPGPGRYGQYYGAPVYGPDDYGPPLAPPTEASIESPPPPIRPLAPAPRVIAEPPSASPPLPRPRPATLASRKSDSAYPAATPLPPALPPASIKTEPGVVTPAPAVTPPAATTSAATGAAATVKPAATTPDSKAQINSEVITAAPPLAPASASSPPKKAPIPVEPLND